MTIPENRAARIGMLQFDARRVVKQLKQDMKDDWFPDPLVYADCMTVEFFRQKIVDLEQKGGGTYEARPRFVRNVPKHGGALRYSLEMDVVDRFVYHALVVEISSALDALLAPVVFSHRVEVHDGRSKRQLFKAPVGQWQLFLECARNGAGESWIVEADLQNFYESISISELRKALKSGLAACTSADADMPRMIYATDMLLYLLPQWCYAETHGLPQNRDASSFLANQVMRSVDSHMVSAGWDYCRYMDDIRIKCKSKHDARRALEDLTEALRRVGLSLNSKKTAIHAPGTPEHDKILKPGDAQLQAINDMWSSRSQDVVCKSIRYITELAASMVSTGVADSRPFRYCINRIELLSRCSDVDIPPETTNGLKALAMSRLVDDAHIVDYLCRYLRSISLSAEDTQQIETLLLDGSLYLYEWQRYHMTLVVLQAPTVSRAMIDAALGALDDEHSRFPRDLAAIIVGKYGTKSERAQVALRFERLSTNWAVQRAAIIAVHELDYVKDLQAYLPAHVSDVNKGMLRNLASMAPGVYVASPEPLPAAELFDSISAYV